MMSLSKILLGAAVCMSSVSAQAIGYTVTNLGATWQVIDINNAGQIVSTINGATGLSEAALWNNGAWQSLSPGAASSASGLNDLGHVVGSSQVNGLSVATVWKDGKAQLLPGFAGYPSGAVDINNAGQIIGVSTEYQDFAATRPVQWTNGKVSYLPGLEGSSGHPTAINEAGQIVGETQYTRYYSATRWVDGKAIALDPELGSGTAWGINSHGTIVGRTGHYGSIWSKDGTLHLDQMSSELRDINDAGAAVGSAYFGSFDGSQRAMTYRNGAVLNLNDLIVGGRDGLGELRYAHGINESGQIVGFASLLGQSDVTHAFLLTPVPEPEHWAMLLVGLGLVGFSARRKV